MNEVVLRVYEIRETSTSKFFTKSKKKKTAGVLAYDKKIGSSSKCMKNIYIGLKVNYKSLVSQIYLSANQTI